MAYKDKILVRGCIRRSTIVFLHFDIEGDIQISIETEDETENSISRADFLMFNDYLAQKTCIINTRIKSICSKPRILNRHTYLGGCPRNL